MKTWAKVSLGCLAIVLAVPVLFAVAFWRMNDALCANDILSEARSPDGRARAIVFRRSCGATTGFSTQVSVVRGTEPLPNDPGNVFVADPLRSEAGSAPDPAVKVRWR